MKKYLVLARNLACFICLFTFLWACEQSTEPPPKPKVVRKKIVAKTDRPAPQPEKEAVRSAAPAGQQPQAPKPASPIIIAKSEEKTAAASSESTPPATKKPAIAPKSDVSAPAPAAPSPEPKPEGAAETGEPQGDESAAASITPSGPGQPPIYNPKGKIDPFEPLFKEKKVVAQTEVKKKKKRIPRTPLERIDLSQLKLVAIVLAKSGNRAMVEEASGKGYVISTGTYIGTNSGKVVKIDKDRVVVAEEVEDVTGNVSIRNSELKLPKPPGEL